MNSWNCCRLCLSENLLNPIFSLPEHNNKYTEIILNTTGVMVEQNDSLPQEMCTECVDRINSMFRFRKQCQLTQETLVQQKPSNSTFSTQNLKSELHKFAQIDVIDYKAQTLDDTDDFTNNYDVMIEVEKTETDAETLISQDLDDEPLKHLFNKMKRKKTNAENVKVKKESKVKRTKVKLKDETVEKEAKEKVREEIKCEYCPKVLSSKLSLRNHYKIHTGFEVVCEHCGKKFITKRLLLMHCRAKHGYEKTDRCSFCDYTASNAEQVKIHERLHTGERPFVCAACGAGFHRNSSYQQHVAIHLPEKTVQCDQCPARFKSVTLMRIHRHRHRPRAYTFKCYLCDSSFARRRNVLRHLSRIHAESQASQPVQRVKIA